MQDCLQQRKDIVYFFLFHLEMYTLSQYTGGFGNFIPFSGLNVTYDT